MTTPTYTSSPQRTPTGHAAARRRRGDRAPIVIVGLAFVAVAGGIALSSGARALDSTPDARLTFLFGQTLQRGGADIHYGSGATLEEAEKLADYLESIGYITEEHEATITIARGGEGLVVGFVLIESAFEDAELEPVFSTIALGASEARFDGQPVTVQLLGDDLSVRRALESSSSSLGSAESLPLTIGVDLRRVRESELAQAHLPTLMSALGGSTSCARELAETVEELRVRMYQPAPLHAIAYARGLDRARFERCAEQGALTLEHDGAFTTLTIQGEALTVRWLSPDELIAGFQDDQPLHDRAALDHHAALPSFEDDATLTRLVDERGDAALWFAARMSDQPGDEQAIFGRARLSSVIELDARARYADAETADGAVRATWGMFGHRFDSPFPQLLISKLSFEVVGREAVVTGELGMLEVLELVASYQEDQEFQRLIER